MNTRRSSLVGAALVVAGVLTFLLARGEDPDGSALNVESGDAPPGHDSAAILEGRPLTLVPGAVGDPPLEELGDAGVPGRQRTLVRGRITGIPLDQIRGAKVSVRLLSVGHDHMIFMDDPASGGDGSPAAVTAEVGEGDTYEVDASSLCAKVPANFLVEVVVQHPRCVVARVRTQAGRGKETSVAPTHRVFRVDVELALALEVVGSVSGAADAEVCVFDLTAALDSHALKDMPFDSFGTALHPVDQMHIDKDGGFRLRAARGHGLLVVADANGRLPLWRILEPTEDAQLDVGVLSLSRGASIEGRLRGSKALANLSIAAFLPEVSLGLQVCCGDRILHWRREDMTPRFQVGERGPGGTFRVDGLPVGMVTVGSYSEPMNDPGPVLHGAIRMALSRKVKAPARNVVLEAEASRLLVEVTDEDGAPTWANVLVSIGETDGQHPAFENGTVELLVPVDVAYRVTSADEDRPSNVVTGRTAGPDGSVFARLRLLPSVEPGSVRITLGKGGSVRTCGATWTRDGHAPEYGNTFEAQLEFEQGAAVLRFLAPGKYRFILSPERGGASAFGWWQDQVVEVAVRSNAEVTARLDLEAGGRVEVVVTDKEKGAFLDCSVEQVSGPRKRVDPLAFVHENAPGDLRMSTGELFWGNPSLVSAPLAAGAYTFRFTRENYVSVERSFVIEVGKTVRIAVQLWRRP